jgi:2,3-bisphosphoglycerate-dependent phosphoglycerate mutase
MTAPSRWPAELLLVRHAESAGNVARDAAEAAGLPVIDIAERDMDVDLSPRGAEQAQALGRWLRGLGASQPEAVLSSPYARAETTALIALDAAGLDLPVLLDERLRERDFGMLDRLTRLGIEQQLPEQAEVRRRLGKFFYRPPGGESWCDVALRVRSALDSISREHPGRRVLVVAHEVVILIFRYVLEHVREADLLALSSSEPLANCSITSFAFDPSDGGGMVLTRFGAVDALADLDAPVTHERDDAVAPR